MIQWMTHFFMPIYASNLVSFRKFDLSLKNFASFHVIFTALSKRFQKRHKSDAKSFRFSKKEKFLIDPFPGTIRALRVRVLFVDRHLCGVADFRDQIRQEHQQSVRHFAAVAHRLLLISKNV